MAASIADFARLLGIVPGGAPFRHVLGLLISTEQRAWSVWAHLTLAGSMNAVHAEDVARYDALRINLWQAQTRLRDEMLEAAGPLRSTVEPRITAPTMLPPYTGSVLPAESLAPRIETVTFYGAAHAGAAAAAPAAPAAVLAGLSPATWAAIVLAALAALAIVAVVSYLTISCTVEAMGATIMAWRFAQHEEQWWQIRQREIDRCMRLYPTDPDARDRCIGITVPPRPNPPESPYGPAAREAPGWVPWAFGGGVLALAGVGLAAWTWGNPTKKLGAVPLDVSRPMGRRIG